MNKKFIPRNYRVSKARKNGNGSRPASNRSNVNGPQPPRLQRDELIERGIPGFRALEYRCKLNYYDTATISTGAGSAGNRIYSTNGLYDPDITGTGHQPMPFDQMILSFEHYVVHSATMSVRFKNTATTSSQAAAISIKAAPTVVTDYIAIMENGTIVSDRLGQYPYGGSIRLLKLACDVAKFGAVRDLMDNPNYEGSAASNPVEQSYFHISVWNPDSVSSTDCIIEVFIEYDATFREPRRNSPSTQALLKKIILQEEKRGTQ